MLFVAIFETSGIGRERVMFAWGSLVLYGSSMLGYLYVIHHGERTFERLSDTYFLANVVSFIARSIFEMSLFVYGSSLADKWVIICLFSLIAISPASKSIIDKVK